MRRLRGSVLSISPQRRKERKEKKGSAYEVSVHLRPDFCVSGCTPFMKSVSIRASAARLSDLAKQIRASVVAHHVEIQLAPHHFAHVQRRIQNIFLPVQGAGQHLS